MWSENVCSGVRRKLSVVLPSVLAACSAFCYEGMNRIYNYGYGNERGWVIPVNDDSDASKNTWTSSTNWPNADGINDPNPDRDYFTIYTSRTICVPQAGTETDAVPFPGRTLRIGGELKVMSNANKWSSLGGNVIMLGGSRLYFNSVGSVTGTKMSLENCGSDYPVFFTFRGRSGDSYGHTFPKVFRPAVVADAGAELHWQQDSSVNSGSTFIMCDEWPEFYGTLRMQSFDNVFAPARFSLPGNLIVEAGAKFEPTASSGNSTFGGLKVCSGATLGFKAVNNTHTITVTNRLEFEPGATVNFRKFGPWTTGTPPKCPVFHLSREAYQAGVPDMSKVNSLFTGCNNTNAALPRFEWVVDETEGGGATLSLTHNEIVTLTNNMLKVKTPFYPTLNADCDPMHFFSDGLAPHSGVDYLADSRNLIIHAPEYPCVFPEGASLSLIDGSALGLYGAFHCDDLVFSGNSRFRQMDTGMTFALSGSMKFVKGYGGFAGVFGCGSLSVYDVRSNISGDGDIRIHLDPENSDRPYAYAGTCEFKGDNSAYSGRILLKSGEAGDFKAHFEDKGLERYEPSSVSNVTLVAHGATSLGGACGSFMFNAVTVSNQSRLALAESAVFAEPTRGWHFAGTTYLRVMNGVSVTARNRITVGGVLVKEGTGLFMAGDVVAEDGCTAEIEVREGSLGAVSADAFAGVGLRFAEGSGLAVLARPEDAVLAAKGFIHHADGVQLALPAGRLSVTVDFSGVDIAAAEPVSVGVMTVADANAEGLRRKLAVANRPVGYACEFRCVSNGDGTSTVVLSMVKKGLKVIVR